MKLPAGSGMCPNRCKGRRNQNTRLESSYLHSPPHPELPEVLACPRLIPLDSDLTNPVCLSNLGVDHPECAGSASEQFGAVRILGHPALTEVPVDVKPGSSTNPIQLSSTGKIPVAIVSTASFDATTVDPNSVCFGDAEAPDQRDCTEAGSSIEDANGDGLADLVMRFEVQQTGIDPGDIQACLLGKTYGETGIEGCDDVVTN